MHKSNRSTCICWLLYKKKKTIMFRGYWCHVTVKRWFRQVQTGLLSLIMNRSRPERSQLSANFCHVQGNHNDCYIMQYSVIWAPEWQCLLSSRGDVVAADLNESMFFVFIFTELGLSSEGAGEMCFRLKGKCMNIVFWCREFACSRHFFPPFYCFVYLFVGLFCYQRLSCKASRQF